MRSLLKRFRALVVLILVALLLRLVFVLILDATPSFSGGDAAWYMRNGRQLVTTGKTPGPLQTAPLYVVFVGTIQAVIPGWPSGSSSYLHTEMQAIRIIQSVWGAGLVLFAFLLGRRWLSVRAGWLSAGLIAFSPALIVEAGNPATESMFLLCLLGGLALYAYRPDRLRMRYAALMGAAFGLATLTRAVFLLFPLGIVVHLFIAHREHWKRLAAVLLVSYSMVVGTWTVYNVIVWDRLVIGGEGLLSFVHQGATGKAGPLEYDTKLGVTTYNSHSSRVNKIKAGIRENILDDPVAWTLYRASELAKSYVQPHNTNYFGGESIRYAAQDWLLEERTLAGLHDLTRIESFWPKLAIYVFHFGSLFLGAAGMLFWRRHWRELLPLYGVIVYFTGIHLVLLALPRYLFPMYPVLVLFSAGALDRLAVRLPAPAHARTKSTQSATPETPLISGDPTL